MEFLHLVGAAVMLIVILFFLFGTFGATPPTNQKETQPGESKVPGLPPSDPETGNLPDLKDAGSFQEFLELLHEQFGGIASFWWNKTWVVSIATPELFKEHNRFFDRPPLLFELFEPFITKHSLQYANGDDGKSRRKIYDKPYGHEALAKHYQPFNLNGKALVKKWLDIPKGQHVALVKSMENVALRGITSTSFGVYFDDDKNVDQLAAIYHKIWSSMEELYHGRSSDVPFMEEFAADKKVLVSLLQKAHEERLNNPVPENEKVFIDVLLESGQSDEVTMADSISYLVGGFHTTANMLSWALNFVATDDEVQEKLYQEIKDVVKGTDVTLEEFSKLIYTHQVLDETMRCSVLAPYAARFSDEETKLGAFNIPAGTPVVHALGVSLMDANMWKNPRRFDPDHFSPDKVKERTSFDFVPFGFAGKRKCPGYRFAYVEGAIMLALILKTFKVKLVEGQKVVREYGLVTHPKKKKVPTATLR